MSKTKTIKSFQEKKVAGILDKAMMNLMEDLNEEKNTLAKAKAKDDAILHNIGEGLVVLDLHQRIEMINAAALKMLGFEYDEMMGAPWLKRVTVLTQEGQKVPKSKMPLFRALKQKKSVFESQFYYCVKENSPLPVAITASPIILDEKVIGIILIFRDITHEKQVDQAKTEFVSFASHQLKTPLSTINWYTEMLLDGDAGKVNKEQKEYLNEVYASCQRMVKLVNDILNVSRLELGTFTIQPEPVELKTIAQEALNELEAKVHEKQIKLSSKYDSKLPVMNLDKKLTHMILLNLLSNAVKYSPEKAKVSLQIIKKQTHILIAVKDNGYGIPKAQQSKIFTKLFRADNVKMMEIEGTGFGLYIIKTIVEKSGGKIWFESEEGKGTTFFVKLPLKGMVARKGEKELS